MASKEYLSKLEKFYTTAKSSFLEWSPDAKRPGLYAMHIGYQNWEDPVSNPDSVLQMSRKIIELSKIKSHHIVLDAGCGVGNLSFEIKSVEPRARVYGIDITHEHIRLANQYQKFETAPSSHFSVQNYEQTAFASGIFDRIIFCESLIHSQNKRALISDSNRVLQPMGIMVIADIFMHTKELTKAEKNIMKGLKTHMHAPGLTHIKKLIALLSENGFSDIDSRNITEHVIAPEEYLVESEKPSNKEEIPQDMVTILTGLQELMRRGRAGYHIVTARKV